MAYVWTREGVAPEAEVVDVPVQDRFPWLGERMMLHEDIIVPRSDELPDEASLEREYCRDRGIQSFLMCPMYCRELVMGNIGLDMIREVRDWTVEDLRRLRLLGDILGNGLFRERKDREIRQLKARLEAENIYLREEIKLKHSYKEMVGQSDVLKSVLSQAEQVATTGASVLILGETGTGKELLARAIHSQSPRRERPMIVANCAALTPTLIESELFGREKGAYTGAHAKQADAICVALSNFQSEKTTAFRENCDNLKSDLEALDRETTGIVAKAADRPVFFSHPVYQYFERHYGLNARSVHWEFDEAPTDAMWTELKGLLEVHPAKWMIWEGEPAAATAETLGEYGLESIVFDPCGNVPADGDYLATQQKNLAALEAAYSEFP